MGLGLGIYLGARWIRLAGELIELIESQCFEVLPASPWSSIFPTRELRCAKP
jgi:hypothetical protein